MQTLANLRTTIYSLAGDDGQWLQRVCDAVDEVMELPLGAALAILKHPREVPVVSELVAAGALGGDLDQLIEPIHAIAGLTGLTNHPSPPSSVVLRSRPDWEAAAGAQDVELWLRSLGAEDLVSVATSESFGDRLLMVAPFTEPVELVGLSRARWEWVATHLSIARRIRRVAASEPPEFTGDGFSDGVDVEGPSGDVLWQALLDGSWVITGSFVGGGQRALVARPVERGDHQGATRRQEQVLSLAAIGHSNKAIAFRLGLAESTVGSHLRNGLSRLGLKSRLELVQVAHYLLADPEAAATADVARPPDWTRIEDALEICAEEFARLDPARHEHAGYQKRLDELRGYIDALERVLRGDSASE